MSNEEIKRLALLKWQMILDHNGYNTWIKYPHALNQLINQCSYCDSFMDRTHGVFDRCDECPINMGFKKGCFNNKHVFTKWNKNRCIKTAQAVYDLILNTPFKNEQ